MAQIGSLVVDLIAQTASFNSNIEKAARNLNSNATRMNRSVAAVEKRLGTLTSFAKGAGTALAGYLTLDLGRRSLEYAGGLGEVAQQLGVTTRGLQIYRFAASQVGVSQQQVDDGLQRLTRTLGQVGAGAKAPTRALEALGFSTAEIERLTRMTADGALPLIADRLARVESASDRAAVEVALFGKSGQQLDPLLKGGSKAINEFARAAQKLGIVLTSAEIQQADDAADKLSAVKTVLEANIARTVASNADSIIKLANSLVALATGAAKFMASNPEAVKGAIGALAGAKIGGVPGAIVVGTAAATGGFDGFSAQLAGSKIIAQREGVLAVLGKSRQELIAAVEEDQRRLQSEFARLNSLRLSLPEGSEVRRSVAGAQAEIGRKIGLGDGAARPAAAAAAPAIEVPDFLAGGGSSAVDDYGRSVARLNEQLATTALELRAVNENWPDSELDAARLKQQLYADIAELGTDVTGAQRAELMRLADALVEQERALTLSRMSQDIATNSAERYAEVIQALTDDVDAFTKAQTEALTQLPDLSFDIPDEAFAQLEADRDFADAIGDSFGFAAEDALMHMDSIRDAAETLLSDLTRLFLRRNVTLPIAELVSGWADSLMGNNGPAVGGFDASAAAAASDAALTQLGADGSNALASLTAAAQTAGTALDASMVPAIGQAVTSTITSATTDGIAAGALQGLTASAIAASAALSAMASQQTVSGISSIALASGAPGFAAGGLPAGRIRGPGSGTSDSILAYVSNEEFIVNAAGTRKWLPVLEAINAGKGPPRFAMGGLPGFAGVRAAMRDVRPANDSGFGGSPHFHYHGDATPDKARRFGKQAAAEYRRELARTAAQGIG